MTTKTPTLKKLAVIGLLSLLFYGQIGYYFAWKWAQYSWKETMRKSLLAGAPDEQLVAISLGAAGNAIDWEEQGHEFRLQGQLYDIVRTKTVNGDTILYCVYDIKEKQILTHLSAVNPARGHQAGGPALPAFKPCLDPAIMVDTELPAAAPGLCQAFIVWSSPLSEGDSPIFSPPPRA